MAVRKVILFSKFERFWHWTQMALIFTLIFTGFGLHGFHTIIPFDTAVLLHTIGALGLVLLWVFAIFWHFTTGTWRHYLPTSQGLFKVARYYIYGIFKGEPHPYKITYQRKHNPLQALAYLGLKILLFPAIWISGILYLLYPFWNDASGASSWLENIAVVHVIAAFAIVIFIIVHVYLLTTGHSFKEHVLPMVNGYDEIDLSDEEIAYLEANEPQKIH